MNQNIVDKLKEEYPQIFEKRVQYEVNWYFQKAKVCHKYISWKVKPIEISMTNTGVNHGLEQVPQKGN